MTEMKDAAEKSPKGNAAAVERLAMILYWKMEHLGPTDYDWDASLEANWANLDGHYREIYLACIDRLRCEPDLWATALERKFADNH